MSLEFMILNVKMINEDVNFNVVKELFNLILNKNVYFVELELMEINHNVYHVLRDFQIIVKEAILFNNVLSTRKLWTSGL